MYSDKGMYLNNSDSISGTNRQAHRAGESFCSFQRSDRCEQIGNKWVSHTREGGVMGPFRDRSTAEFASQNLVEFIRLAPDSLRQALERSLSAPWPQQS